MYVLDTVFTVQYFFLGSSFTRFDNILSIVMTEISTISCTFYEFVFE